MAVLGLGLAALGRPGYMTVGHSVDLPSTSLEAMRGHAQAMCQAAFDAGVAHFDTARSYGEAEAFLAQWLAAQRPVGVTVSSKWGYRYTANWAATAPVHEVKEHTRAHAEAQWPQSKALLGEWLNVYQVHSATLESGVLDDGAVLDFLASLRDAGTAMGLSVTGPRQADIIRKALGVTRGGRRVFEWVQATWNVLEQSAGPALADAHAQGLRVIIKEPVANGRLGPRGDVPAFLAHARELQVGPDTLALAAALAQPWADVVLMGAVTLEQLRSNLLAPSVQAPKALAFALKPEQYWAERATLIWT
jgi:aryl-alcohol dehydrogenase-like predicted oxidoreductase